MLSLIKTFSVYTPTIVWEMKASANKVLTDNEKICATLVNCGVGVKKINKKNLKKEAGGLNKYQVLPTPSHHGIT